MNGLFITGTDTDAGKTTVTAALLRAMLDAGLAARAVKPVQTGCEPAADGMLAPDVACYREAVAAYCGPSSPLSARLACVLETFAPACSPHLAARLANRPLSAAGLRDRLLETGTDDACLLVEGAGGIHVPLNDHETLLDFMALLGLPVLLVVGNRLGCINHALLSLDVLTSRGLSVLGMVINRTAPLPDSGIERGLLEDNAQTLAAIGARRGIPVLANLPCLGAPLDDTAWRSAAETLAPVRDALLSRLAATASAQQPNTAEQQALSGIAARPQSPQERLAFDRKHLWHPYTSALNPLPVFEAAGTRGCRIRLRDGRELVDGMSSWWCAIHGYGHPKLIRAVQRQAETMSHVMFGGLTHEPAVELARRLLAILPGNLEHLFYADSGSVAVEVALKMAVQYWQSRGRAGKTRFLVPRGGYHGDTQGAMSVCDPVTGMHGLFSGLLPGHLFVERPSCRFDSPFDPQSLRPMREALEAHAHSVAAVIHEPVVQGAGGMWFYHPDYLRGLRALCDAHEVLLIVDEIATGFGRTGRLFASEWADLQPDILCLGKGLTGGMLTLAATAASHAVAEGLEEAGPQQGGGVFMHGPTFMANPLACAAGCASLDLLAATPWQERVAAIENGLAEGLAPCREMPGVRDVRVLGAIGVVEVDKPVDMARMQAFFVERGVWVRPFNRNVYLMPPYCIEPDELSRLTGAITEAVNTL